MLAPLASHHAGASPRRGEPRGADPGEGKLARDCALGKAFSQDRDGVMLYVYHPSIMHVQNQTPMAPRHADPRGWYCRRPIAALKPPPFVLRPFPPPVSAAASQLCRTTGNPLGKIYHPFVDILPPACEGDAHERGSFGPIYQ